MSRDQRLQPIHEEGNGRDGCDDHDQRHEARAKPTAMEHRRTRLVLLRIVGEELGHLVAELMVRLLDGLQAELELPLFRDAAKGSRSRECRR